jgi:hypothetical protein
MKKKKTIRHELSASLCLPDSACSCPLASLLHAAIAQCLKSPAPAPSAQQPVTAVHVAAARHTKPRNVCARARNFCAPLCLGEVRHAFAVAQSKPRCARSFGNKCSCICASLIAPRVFCFAARPWLAAAAEGERIRTTIYLKRQEHAKRTHTKQKKGDSRQTQKKKKTETKANVTTNKNTQDQRPEAEGVEEGGLAVAAAAPGAPGAAAVAGAMALGETAVAGGIGALLAAEEKEAEAEEAVWLGVTGVFAALEVEAEVAVGTGDANGVRAVVAVLLLTTLLLVLLPSELVVALRAMGVVRAALELTLVLTPALMLVLAPVPAPGGSGTGRVGLGGAALTLAAIGRVVTAAAEAGKEGVTAFAAAAAAAAAVGVVAAAVGTGVLPWRAAVVPGGWHFTSHAAHSATRHVPQRRVAFSPHSSHTTAPPAPPPLRLLVAGR